jgi:prepilin-type N-terminal cleavage/methylation domain-containing protein
MKLLITFLSLNNFQSRNHDSSSGFTMLESLIAVMVIGILSALIAPTWTGFISRQSLNSAQSQVYEAMNQARSQAKRQKITWQASFREQNGIVQWAVHPATVRPVDAVWNNLDASLRLDGETTLQLSDGVRQIQFDYLGTVKKPPLGRLTLSSKAGGTTKRCVIVSTILGTLRLAQENDQPDNGKYCY